MEQKPRVTNDWIFQNIFGKVGKEEIIKRFLERTLKIKVEGLTLDVNKQQMRRIL